MADLPPAFEAAFESGDPQTVFDALMPVMCEGVNAQRCFLYLRDDTTKRGGTVASWSVDPQWPDMRRAFEPEMEDLYIVGPDDGSRRRATRRHSSSRTSRPQDPRCSTWSSRRTSCTAR